MTSCSCRREGDVMGVKEMMEERYRDNPDADNPAPNAERCPVYHLTLDGGIDVDLRGLLREFEQGRVSCARTKQLIDEAADARVAEAEKPWREFVKFLSFQPCTYDAEGAGESLVEGQRHITTCDQTSACITEWCGPCHARALLKASS